MRLESNTAHTRIHLNRVGLSSAVVERGRVEDEVVQKKDFTKTQGASSPARQGV